MGTRTLRSFYQRLVHHVFKKMNISLKGYDDTVPIKLDGYGIQESYFLG